MQYMNQNELLLENLTSFYCNNDHANLRKVLDIWNGTSAVSLRLMDWFVTNYAKEMYLMYTAIQSDSGLVLIAKPMNRHVEVAEPVYDPTWTVTHVNVHKEYKLKLKAYSKKRFDPFGRGDKIYIPFEHNLTVDSTLCQMNFFKWVLDNHVLEYIQAHHKEIERDMNARNTSNKPRTDKTVRKKRKELSTSNCKSIKREFREVTMLFC